MEEEGKERKRKKRAARKLNLNKKKSTIEEYTELCERTIHTFHRTRKEQSRTINIFFPPYDFFLPML